MEFSSILLLSLTFHAILLLFVNFSFPASTSAAVVGNETDRLALLAFKSEITEDPQGVLDSWNSTIHFCQWAGVICGQKHQRVITLDLRGLRLAGVISPRVGNISFLRLLDLSDNSFHGVIPSEFDHLVRLQTMNLSFNLLRGEIPPNLSYCERLVNLLLDHNFLERHVPLELGSLTKLVKLYLRNNNLTGTIPASIGNLTSLQELYISYNELHGEFPDTMAQLRSLTQLGMSMNLLSGEFPPVLYNLSSLKLIALSFNNFKGSLRPDIGLKFPNLQRLYLASNQFSGSIPASLSNSSELLQLDIPMNNFTGNIPKSLGNLQNIYWINFLTNQLGSGAPDDLSFISSLTNCRKLEFLDIAENNFGGVLPNSITNLSRSMTRLLVGSNIIRGTIPKEISNLVNLNVLSIKETLISGTIPDSIGMLSNLKNLHLESNQLRGKIPSSLGNIKGILYIFLQDNKLEGSIPPNLGNCRLLQTLVLSKNNLTGAIPKEVISLSSLSIVLNISKNFLSGPLPAEVGNLTNLAALDLSYNNISGKIPSTLGNCLSLEMLYMQGNSFEGTIPATLDNLKNVHYLDVSNNKLSGPVPRSMAKLSSLLYLNLSFNNLEGEMPVQGAFGDASKIQVSGNTKLCGGIMQLHLQPCPRQVPRKAKKHTALKVILITAILGSCLTLLVLLLLFLWKRKVRSRTFSASSTVDMHRKVSYKDLMSATAGFSVHNLIGSGNFGIVYKGSLDGTEVAVKVIKLQQRGACKSFLAECQVLRTIRHRNLVKILTACSSTDFHGNEFKALVYQYVRNGSLEKWLHPDDGHREQRSLSIFHRLNIVIDVASALHYLHSQCQTPVVHCDLKPSNVLLDDDLTAHVSDFGLAKLLLNSPEDANLSQFSSLGIKGTIGYAAPEYGMGSQVSTNGDVYSFGIFLLEILTRKRPTDELFKDNANLRSFVQQALPDQVMDIVDQSALYKEEPGDLMETTEWESYSRIELKECLLSLFRLGLKCSEQAPQDRMNMMQVSMDLIPVREKLNRPSAYEGKFELEVSSEI